MNEYEALLDFVREAGTQREAARRLHITEPAISQMLKKYRRVPDDVLKRLGLKRAVIEAGR